MPLPPYVNDLSAVVAQALAEDVGSGDVTARLVAQDRQARARVIAREAAVICGRPWVDEVFRQIDPRVTPDWQIDEGARANADQVVFTLRGPARALLTGERTALNFLQTLSGTATAVAAFVDTVAGTGCRIADTRKTLPGLRNAQKYAVLCGGGVNHRIGLYDGILIKENHVAAAGGIAQAIAQARALHADVPLMTEAETLDEVDAALAADVDLLLVDAGTPRARWPHADRVFRRCQPGHGAPDRRSRRRPHLGRRDHQASACDRPVDAYGLIAAQVCIRRSCSSANTSASPLVSQAIAPVPPVVDKASSRSRTRRT
jgi:nicotinate-nucleotide pyrophosphorylase (carboxylating)